LICEERRRYLEALLGAAPVAVVTLDPGNRVVEWNREAEELFGYTGEEARGRELDELVARGSEAVSQDARDNTRRVINGEVLEQVEGIRYRKDGSPVHVVVAAARIDMDGEAIGAVVTYKDISRRKAAEAALQRERDEVRQLLEQQKLLVQEVHHRIKNDMAFVRSLLSLQSHRAGSKEVADSLWEASDRVSVMSRVYERMYLAMDFRNVDGKAFIDGLVEDLRASSIPPGVAISVARRKGTGSPSWKLSWSSMTALFRCRMTVGQLSPSSFPASKDDPSLMRRGRDQGKRSHFSR
jgi:PAS domain S-box-containing protein